MDSQIIISYLIVSTKFDSVSYLFSADNAINVAVIRHLPLLKNKSMLYYMDQGALIFRIIAILLITILALILANSSLSGLYLLFMVDSHIKEFWIKEKYSTGRGN